MDELAQKLVANEPRYIILQDDENSQEGNKKCVFIMFVPDIAKVRSKMLYASSSSALQRQLGGAGYFSRQIFWTEIEEVSGKGWKEHLAHEKLSAPLTDEERSLQDVREKEVGQMLGTNARKSHVNYMSGGSAVQVKIHDEAKAALEALASSAGVVGLSMDMAAEILVLSKSKTGGSSVTKQELVSSYIDANNPQFTVYKPTSTGAATFIYTCPSGSKVKERMVYAVNRKSVAKIARDLGIEIGKEIEGTDGEEVVQEIEENGEDQASVAKERLVTKPRFNRPKAPGRR